MVGRVPHESDADLVTRAVHAVMDASDTEVDPSTVRIGTTWVFVPAAPGWLFVSSTDELVELGTHAKVEDFVWAFERGVKLGGFERSDTLTITSASDVSAAVELLEMIVRRRVTTEELGELPLVFEDVDLYYSVSDLRALEGVCSFVVSQVDSVIEFYSVGAQYGEFSNFAPYPIVLQGVRWPTSEHYFQAQKFRDPSERAEVRAAKTPMIAARLGRDRGKKLRRDWESAKDDVMREAVEAKFRQHASLRELLLSTGTAKLVEHTTNDSYWGDGGDGRGKNMLGRILMEVRAKLAHE